MPVILTDEMLEEGKNIPELPDQKRKRMVSEYGIKEKDAVVITSSLEMANYYENMIKEGASAKNSLTWLTTELLGRLKGVTLEESPVSSKKLALIVKRIEDNTISGKAAKEVLDFVMKSDDSVDEVIEKLGLKQVSDDGAIESMVDAILLSNEDKVEQYKAGKDKLFGFFVGQVMKQSKGSANPAKVNEILKKKLS